MDILVLLTSVCLSTCHKGKSLLVKFSCCPPDSQLIVEVRSALSHTREGWDRCWARIWTI